MIAYLQYFAIFFFYAIAALGALYFVIKGED